MCVYVCNLYFIYFCFICVSMKSVVLSAEKWVWDSSAFKQQSPGYLGHGWSQEPRPCRSAVVSSRITNHAYHMCSLYFLVSYNK